MNTFTQDDLRTHVPILGWLLIAGNAIFLVIAALSLTFLIGIGFLSGDAEAARILTFIAIITAGLFGTLSLPGIVAGIGLLRRAAWGRILALIVGFLSLINFPIGTAIGIYAIWVLLQSEAEVFFRSVD
jgi:hypothetical protein